MTLETVAAMRKTLARADQKDSDGIFGLEAIQRMERWELAENYRILAWWMTVEGKKAKGKRLEYREFVGGHDAKRVADEHAQQISERTKWKVCSSQGSGNRRLGPEVTSSP